MGLFGVNGNRKPEKRCAMKTRGFTLLELMIILTIISTLTSLAIPNLIRARMAANEVAAIAQLKALGTTQEIYRRTDWDGNGIKEYAQNIGNNGGNANLESLFFNVRNNSNTGLIDTSVCNAEIPNTGSTSGTTPRGGYLYYVQLGATYPAVVSFVNSNGVMNTGYSFCSIPYTYGINGVNTFQMNSSGVVYARDQGTNLLVAAYNNNPTNGWYQNQ